MNPDGTQNPVRYAGFWIRSVASLIDEVLLGVVSWILTYAVLGAVYWIARGIGTDMPLPFNDVLKSFTIQIINFVLYSFAGMFYTIWMHCRWGRTLGKWPFGITVVDARSHQLMSVRQSTLRCVAQILSALPMGAGYMMVMFHPRKQALHDLIADTVSVRSGV